jgi:hypothetical protein
LAWRRRKAALAAAGAAAAALIADEQKRRVREQAERQADLDALWRGLNENDADVVMAALAAAFEDNDAAAAPLDVTGSEAALVVIVPTASSMPTRKPAVTPTGRPTTKALGKKEAADWHKIAICGYAITTVREAFAVAPKIESVRIVAAAVPPLDSYGRRNPEVLLAARFDRDRLSGVRWGDVDAVQAINDINTELRLNQVGVTKALAPLDLSDEPELAALVEQIDYSDLLGATQ